MKKLIFAVICSGFFLSGFADIKTEVDFSTDGGKTWSEDFPILKKSNPRCKVRLKYQVDEPKEIEGKIVTGMLRSNEKDFASANRGLQRWEEGRAWYQQLKTYWKNARTGTPYIYDLDLGERKAGVMGQNNKWDKTQKKYISVPLPECPAYVPGTYKFHVRAGYRTAADRKLHQSTQSFDIIIEE